MTNVKERKTRTAVMLLSILLSTTLLFVSFSISTSYESAQRKMAQGMAGSATISVTAPKDRNSNLDTKEIPYLPSIGAKVQILESSSLYHEKGYYETVDLIAAELSELNQINKPRLLDGGEIDNFTGNKIVLPDRFTSKYGIKQGDSITLQIGRSGVQFEVAQIAAYDTVFLRHTRGATGLVPVSTLSNLLGQRGGNSKILIKPAQDITTNDLVNELKLSLSDKNYSVSKIVNEAKIMSDARQKSIPFFLISFFSLTISVFIIYSSYKVITLDRLPVIGTFRSIGATQKVVTRILLLESLLYGVMGGLIGIPLGVFMLKLILQGMGHSLSQGIEIPVVISPYSILISFAVAIIVSLLSAWIPVRRASRLPIKEVVLGTIQETTISRRFIYGIGFVLFVLSILLPRLAPKNMLYVAGGFSLLGFIAGTILIIPPVTNLVARGLERLYGIIFRNEGRLAARNMRDNKSISQNITLLFISISAVIAISVVGSFVTTYISDVFNGAELQGFADGQMEQQFVEQVEKMEGINKVLPLFVLNNEVKGDDISFSRLEATDSLASYTSMFAIHYSAGSMQEKEIANFATQRSILLSEASMDKRGISVGDTLTLSKGDITKSYVVVGSFKSRATDTEAVIPSSYAVSDFGKKKYGLLAYTAADPDAIMIQIRNLFGDTTNWSRTIEEFNTDALSTVGAFLQPMHSMTYFILLLAAVGIINNLLINYMQKRRAIAMYKSVGLSDRQNMRMTLIEGFSSGLIGTVIAILVSYLEIQTIFLVAGPKISMEPKLDATIFLMAGGMGILITLLGSIVPIFKSRQMKLVEEIKFE
ncbi:ABC transporter permease [Paenibacillus turicensis]|uniref:ABC transporter permease n=1 Tax=Paenibacillus turicensis TaxID=160487 RepID=UPI001AE45F52|nr:FtsX-like permease family protein [Paenibacillus turicensis]